MRLVRAGRWWIVWLLLAAALAAWRHEVLWWPPYWDCTIGLWTEANFLAETDFDYNRLRLEEKSVWEGGAKSYVTSILPTLIALGMRSGLSTETHLLLWHLVAIGCAAGILLLVVAVTRPVAGWAAAVLAAIAVLTTPVFRVQVDMVGMELPMTLFALIAARCLLDRRFAWAALAATMAFLMKPTGGLLTLSGIVLAGLWWIVAPESNTAGVSRRQSLRAVVILAVAWIVQWGVIRWGETVEALMQSRYQHPLATLPATLFWCPDLILLLTVCFVATLWMFGRQYRAAVAVSAASKGAVGALMRRFRAWRSLTARWLIERPELVLGWIVLLGTLAAIFRVSFLPRYIVIAVPFVYIVLLSLMGRSGRWVRLAPLLLAAIVVINLINSDGRLFPSLQIYPGRELARSGALIERSGEYLADHRENLAALDAVLASRDDEPLIVSRPHVDFLAMPRLGYVDKALHGLVVNSYSDLLAGQFKTISMDDEFLPARPILFYIDTTWSRLSNVFEIPPPGPHDEVLYRGALDPPLIVYRKGWPTAEPTQRQVEDWYLDHMWPNARETDRAMFRVAWLWRTGRAEEAWREARAAVREHPRDFYLRQWLYDLELARGDLEQAVAVMCDMLPADVALAQKLYAPDTERGVGPPLEEILPPSAEAIVAEESWPKAYPKLHDALAALRRGDLEATYVHTAGLIDAKVRRPSAVLLRVFLALELGFADEAASEAWRFLMPKTPLLGHNGASMLKEYRFHVLSRHALIRAKFQRGSLGNAYQLAEQFVKTSPQFPRGWRTLGFIQWRLDEVEAAIDSFRQSLALDPDDQIAVDALRELTGEEVTMSEAERSQRTSASDSSPAVFGFDPAD